MDDAELRSSGKISITLQATDSGTLKNDGSFVGVVIKATDGPDRYVFLEYRTSSPSYLGNQDEGALIMNWADIETHSFLGEGSGRTGKYGTGEDHSVSHGCCSS